MQIALVAYHVESPAGPGPHCADRYCADQSAQVRGLGRALAAQGHRVVIYARRESAALADTVTLGRGVTMRYISAGPAAPVTPQQLSSHLGAFASQLAGWLRRTRPDVVHAFHWTSGLAALTAVREQGVPVVQSFGSLAAAEQRCGVPGRDWQARARMEACIGRAVSGVLAATTEEAGDLARLGIPGSRVSVVPIGIDVGQAGRARKLRRRGDEVRLLHVGSLAADQRADTLIGALRELPGAELVIAAGPALADLDSDPGYKRLGKLAAELGVADRVTFTGWVDDAELAPLMRSADLLVSAARYEPIGRVALSAMACGVPVVATGVGAYFDAIIDGTTGLLLPPGGPEIIGRRLRDLLSTPMRLTAYGIAGSDRASSRYSWDRIAAETEAVYEGCLTRAAGAPARVGSRPAARPASTPHVRASAA
jgi:glycosyltransferase involved in cell wall biosynthesis